MTGENIHCNGEGVSAIDMDPLSISVTIIAILETTEKVIHVGLDFMEAMEERRSCERILRHFHPYLSD